MRPPLCEMQSIANWTNQQAPLLPYLPVRVLRPTVGKPRCDKRLVRVSGIQSYSAIQSLEIGQQNLR